MSSLRRITRTHLRLRTQVCGVRGEPDEPDPLLLGVELPKPGDRT